MARHSSTPFALREAQGKWSLVAELDRLEDDGELLVSIGQAAPDLPIERYDPKIGMWREVGRVPLTAATPMPLASPIKASRPRSRVSPLVPFVGLLLIGTAIAIQSGLLGKKADVAHEAQRVSRSQGVSTSPAEISGAGSFVRSTDDFDGASALLSYVLYADDRVHAMKIVCHQSKSVFVSFDDGSGQAAPTNDAISVKLKLDEEEAVIMPFSGVKGYSSMVPGAPPSDPYANALDTTTSEAFLTTLEGHRRLVFQVVSSMGMTLNEPSVVYDISGIDHVAQDVLETCGKR